MPLGPEIDPNWTAFRYVLGELSTAELVAFEGRLLDDQAAREAVAAAVELAGALAVVGGEPVRFPIGRRPGRGRRALAWSGVVALAATLVAMVLPPSPDHPGTGSRPSDVALAWSRARSDAPEDSSLGWMDAIERPPVADLIESDPAEPARPPAPALVDEDEPAPAVDLDPAADRALPSWLVAAAASPTPGSPFKKER